MRYQTKIKKLKSKSYFKKGSQVRAIFVCLFSPFLTKKSNTLADDALTQLYGKYLNSKNIVCWRNLDLPKVNDINFSTVK